MKGIRTNVRLLLPCLALALGALLGTGCASKSNTIGNDGDMIETSAETSNTNLGEKASYSGPKARLAVSNFECEAEKCSGRIGEGLTNMIQTALVRSNRFIVVASGEQREELKEEIAFSESEYAQEGHGPKARKMEAPDIVLTGSITAFKPEVSGQQVKAGAGGLLGNNSGLGGFLKMEKNNAYIRADLQLIDVATTRIINATQVQAQAASYETGVGGGFAVGRTVPLAGSFEQYKDTPMEKAVAVMLAKGVKKMAKLVPKDYYRVKQSRAQEPAGK